jgi:hypothetical protein
LFSAADYYGPVFGDIFGDRLITVCHYKEISNSNAGDSWWAWAVPDIKPFAISLDFTICHCT